MLLVLYFIDKVKRFRLSREAKNKAEKNRSKVAELFWKSIHAARAERAQEERERKRRELKGNAKISHWLRLNYYTHKMWGHTA